MDVWLGDGGGGDECPLLFRKCVVMRVVMRVVGRVVGYGRAHFVVVLALMMYESRLLFLSETGPEKPRAVGVSLKEGVFFLGSGAFCPGNIEEASLSEMRFSMFGSLGRS